MTERLLQGSRLWRSVGIPTRAANALFRDGVLTWDDLLGRGGDYEAIPGIGAVGAEAIERAVRQRVKDTTRLPSSS